MRKMFRRWWSVSLADSDRPQLRQAPSGLSSTGAIVDTHDMITKNIGMLLLAIYLIAVGILTLTGLGIGIITGVLALLSGIFILIGR